MANNPFKPPQASVADTKPERSAKWGRSIWLHLPLFGFLSITGATLFQQTPSAFSLSSIGIGLALTTLLLIRPLQALIELSEEKSPWYWDLLYYATVGVAVSALANEDLWLFVATFLPTHLMNGIFGFGALAIERKRGVRVYTSGRCWVFENTRNAL